MGVISGYNDIVRSDCFGYLPKSAKTILDFGGGNGATAAAVKQGLGADKCVVVEAFEADASLASGVDAHYNGDIFEDDFFERLASNHGPFDLILALDVLEHLIDPWGAVQRLHRLLAPQGYLLVALPNVGHFEVAYNLFAKGEWRYRDDGILDKTHLRFFVERSARELVVSSGLVVRDFGTQNQIPERLLTKLIRRFWKNGWKHLSAYRFYYLVQRTD